MKKYFGVRCEIETLKELEIILTKQDKFKYTNRNRLINEFLDNFIKENK
ncbi:hypothetical protein [Cetobacterium sp.]